MSNNFKILARNKKYYNEFVTESFTDEQLEILEEEINNADLSHLPESRKNMMKLRYSIVDDEVQETPQETIMLTAMALSKSEAKSQRLNFCLDIFRAVWERKISLATPILSNARRVSTSISTASCFILLVEDNLDSILNSVYNAGKISSFGGGLGICLDQIRSKGSKVREDGIHDGVCAFGSLFNSIAEIINQGGKRKGSFTIALGIHHNDIEDIINLRSEFNTSLGNYRTKCSDLYNQVIIHDEFMRRVVSGEDWYTYDPKELADHGINLTKAYGEKYERLLAKAEQLYFSGELKRVKVYDPKELLKQIFKNQVETGFPYIFWKDTANRGNVTATDDLQSFIPCGNLCMESFTPMNQYLAHTCNLSSVNATTELDGDLEYYTKLCVKILNGVIHNFSENLINLAIDHNKLYRSIGIGIIGLADYFASINVKYSDKEAVEIASDITERMAISAAQESILYAKRYPCRQHSHPDSSWKHGKIYNKDLSWFIENSQYPEEWKIIADDVTTHGIANSYLLAIAPNTSTGALLEVSPSWFPRYNITYQYKWHQDSVELNPPISSEFWDNYELDMGLDQSYKVAIVAAMSKWIDQGVSFELCLDLNKEYDKPIPQKLYDWFMESWRSGVKSWYYLTTKPLLTCDIQNLDSCSSCSG